MYHFCFLLFLSRKGQNRDPVVQSILNEFDFFIIPVSNPDGYEFSRNSQRFWRKNRSGSGACKGVDLNRNWGQEWGGQGSSGRRCSDTYRCSSIQVLTLTAAHAFR